MTDSQPSISECFLCGRSFTYRPATGDDSSRFCGPLCREAYDGGQNPARELGAWWQASWQHVAGPQAYVPKPMARSGEGFAIQCQGCGRTFQTLGLAYCSDQCRARARARAENLAKMAEAGMDAPPAKRPCEHPGCGQTIPKWRNGRRVPANARFCDRHSRTPKRLWAPVTKPPEDSAA